MALHFFVFLSFFFSSSFALCSSASDESVSENPAFEVWRLIDAKRTFKSTLEEETLDEMKAALLCQRLIGLFKALKKNQQEELSQEQQELEKEIRVLFSKAFILFSQIAYSREKEIFRCLISLLEKYKDDSINEEEQREAKKISERQKNAEMVYFVDLAKKLSIAPLKIAFAAKVERVFWELVEFSHILEQSHGKFPSKGYVDHRTARRNMVWMVREKFAKVWRECGLENLDYARVALVLKAYEENGIFSAYGLCDLSHKRHVNQNTNARNTLLAFFRRYEDVTSKTLGRHLSLLAERELCPGKK